MDIIKIDNLEVFGNHGVYQDEKKNGQYFYIDMRLYTDFKGAAETDELCKTVDYGDVCDFAAEFVGKNTFDLIETVADGLAEEILLRFPAVREAYIEVKKPRAPIAHKFGCVSVCTSRKWHRVFIAFGSNMGEREKNIAFALNTLKSEETIRLKKISDIIETKPWGGVEQNDFLNGAMEVETLLEPIELLKLLKEIEADCGRTETVHWGPRILDLDIIFFDDLIMDSKSLTIPHREMHKRDFVKIPLSQIAPDFVHPIIGKRICEL